MSIAFPICKETNRKQKRSHQHFAIPQYEHVYTYVFLSIIDDLGITLKARFETLVAVTNNGAELLPKPVLLVDLYPEMPHLELSIYAQVVYIIAPIAKIM